MAVKNAKVVIKKMFAFVSIAVEMQAMLHIVSFLNDIEFIKVLLRWILAFAAYYCETIFLIFQKLCLLQQSVIAYSLDFQVIKHVGYGNTGCGVFKGGIQN